MLGGTKRDSVHTQFAGAFGFEKKYKIKKTNKWDGDCHWIHGVFNHNAGMYRNKFILYSELFKTATIPIWREKNNGVNDWVNNNATIQKYPENLMLSPHACANTCTHIRTRTRIQKQTNKHTHVCTHALIHTQMHTHTQTHTRTHTQNTNTNTHT